LGGHEKVERGTGVRQAAARFFRPAKQLSFL
jgi:hypothetical protein